MRRPLSIAAMCLAVAAAFAVGACGGAEDTTPTACLSGMGAYLHALEGAPGEVALGGDTPISGCLVENQKAGDLADVGLAMLGTATVLNAEARKDPGGAKNLQLGFLVGAAQRGAEDSGGVHSELIRRLAAAASYSPGKGVLPPRFESTYRQGFDAGRARG